MKHSALPLSALLLLGTVANGSSVKQKQFVQQISLMFERIQTNRGI